MFILHTFREAGVKTKAVVFSALDMMGEYVVADHSDRHYLDGHF